MRIPLSYVLCNICARFLFKLEIVFSDEISNMSGYIEVRYFYSTLVSGHGLLDLSKFSLYCLPRLDASYINYQPHLFCYTS